MNEHKNYIFNPDPMLVCALCIYRTYLIYMCLWCVMFCELKQILLFISFLVCNTSIAAVAISNDNVWFFVVVVVTVAKKDVQMSNVGKNQAENRMGIIVFVQCNEWDNFVIVVAQMMCK